MSRSAFVDRSTTLIGMPPIRYLTIWRLQTAKLSLRETRSPRRWVTDLEKHSAERSSGKSGCHPRGGETSSRWIDAAYCNDAPGEPLAAIGASSYRALRVPRSQVDALDKKRCCRAERAILESPKSDGPLLRVKLDRRDLERLVAVAEAQYRDWKHPSPTARSRPTG